MKQLASIHNAGSLNLWRSKAIRRNKLDYHKAGMDWASLTLKQLQTEEQDFHTLLEGEALQESGSKGVLVAEGDSWFDYRPFGNRDVLRWLRSKHGYDVREAGPQYGDTLQEMADDPGQLKRVFDCLSTVHRDGLEPRAILLSGGGNDIATKESLSALLNHKNSGLPPLKDQEVDDFISTRMRNQLFHWIGAVDALCTQLFDKRIPIFVHGYSRPVPDGDAFGWDWIGAFPGPWLRPAFVRKGYWGTEDHRVPEAEALAETTPIIGEIIDRFNVMLQLAELEMDHLHHVDLRSVLTNALPNAYKADWANELHPKKRGFKALAAAMAARIEDAL